MEEIEGRGKQLHVTALRYDVAALERELRRLAESKGAQARIDSDWSQVGWGGGGGEVEEKIEKVRERFFASGLNRNLRHWRFYPSPRCVCVCRVSGCINDRGESKGIFFVTLLGI